MTAHTKQRGPGGRRIEMMRRRLDLTDAQAETLRQRLGEHRRQMVEIIREVLDDEQRAKFDAHLERRRGRGRDRGRGHHGHHRHGDDRCSDVSSAASSGTADSAAPETPTDAA